MSSRNYDNVIVFGPTGAVGSSAALEASKRGAKKVWLAMRDTSKPLPSIPEATTDSPFARIQADLSDPASLRKAVAESGATAAFIYLVFGAPHGMRDSLQALKDAGIENLVFLSSSTVGTQPFDGATAAGLRAIPAEAVIPYAHAQVELAIDQVEFAHVTALRPGYFASNWLRSMVDRTEAPPPRLLLANAKAEVDNIVPEDIGAVGGAALVEAPTDGKKEAVYLVGPEIVTMGEACATIKRITGHEDWASEPLPTDEVAERLQRGAHLPPPLAKYLAQSLSVENDITSEDWFAQAASNIKKYTGREPTKFVDYLETQKSEWAAL